MATHPNILAWRIPWTEESGRLWSVGSHRVGHGWRGTERAHTKDVWQHRGLCQYMPAAHTRTLQL